MHMTCLHCGTRLEKNVQSRKDECPACIRKCDVCGYIKLPVLSRFGPERPFENFKHLRLAKRKKGGYMLEIQDRNSIYRNHKGVRYSRHFIVEVDTIKNASRCAAVNERLHPLISDHRFSSHEGP